MDSGFSGRRRVIGTTASVTLFIAWILIDLYVFPLIGIETHYPLYELVTYSSWAVIALVCFLLLAWAGWFPMKTQEPDSETPSEA